VRKARLDAYLGRKEGSLKPAPLDQAESVNAGDGIRESVCEHRGKDQEAAEERKNPG